MDTVDKRSIKEKWEDFKWKAKKKKDETVQWCKEHPEYAFFALTTAVGGLSYGGKKVFNKISSKREMRNLECRHYDRRTDTYWFSKRPLNTGEKLIMEKKYTEGLSKGEILHQMGLLK